MIFTCDVCGYTTVSTTPFPEGWEEAEYGIECPSCSSSRHEMDEKNKDSTTFAAVLMEQDSDPRYTLVNGQIVVSEDWRDGLDWADYLRELETRPDSELTDKEIQFRNERKGK